MASSSALPARKGTSDPMAETSPALSSPERLVSALRLALPRILEREPVGLAYLYGSAATGETTPFSDLDIALVADEGLSPHERLKLMLRVQLGLSDLYDIANADVRVINDAPLVLRGKVVGDGILVYARDDRERIDFEVTTRLRYFDYRPVYDRLQEAFLARLREHGLDGDRDKLAGLYQHLQRYTTYLRELAEQDRSDFLRDPKSIGSARYYLQVSIEACIGIANHIIASERLRAPKDYKDSFQVLHEAGILSADLTRTMRELAGLRNLLVHLYWDVDDQMVYEGISAERGDFAAFVRCILAFLDQSDAQGGSYSPC